MLKPKLSVINPALKEVALNYLRHFKLGKESVDKLITEGQLHIFIAIVFRIHKYVEIICYTQYGKSLITALACLIISCIQGKLICVIAPSKNKAKLIMRYYINHIGDHSIFYTQLEKNTKLERLKQEESKERIVLKNGGGIFCLSADQKNSRKSIEAAMGESAEVVIIDEGCIIEDDTEATAFRMITGKKAEDKLYCKIGNPFYSLPPNAHFKLDWENPLYHKIFIDSTQGLKEGRIQQEEIDIAARKPLFDILYNCEFPPEDVIDKDGYYKLILNDWIKYAATEAIVKQQIEREELIKKEISKLKEADSTTDNFKKIKELKKELSLIPRIKLGADIARGKDYNVYVIRKGKYAFVAGKNQSSDTMVNINEIERIMEYFNILAEDVNIDDTGVGGGVVDRLREIGHGVNGVCFGGKAIDSNNFANIRAEIYWNTMIWIKDGGLLDENQNWQELLWIKYKQQTGEKKIILESKENLKKRTKKSPDWADSLALTFASGEWVGFI